LLVIKVEELAWKEKEGEGQTAINKHILKISST